MQEDKIISNFRHILKNHVHSLELELLYYEQGKFSKKELADLITERAEKISLRTNDFLNWLSDGESK